LKNFHRPASGPCVKFRQLIPATARPNGRSWNHRNPRALRGLDMILAQPNEHPSRRLTARGSNGDPASSYSVPQGNDKPVIAQGLTHHYKLRLHPPSALTSRQRAGRARPRRPTTSGPIAKRGPLARLPKRYQTDTRLYMAWEDILAIIDAEQFAAFRGFPLTAFLTVNWKGAPAFKGECRRSWEQEHRWFVRLMSRLLRRCRIPKSPSGDFMKDYKAF
jgi:hypothetical protein